MSIEDKELDEMFHGEPKPLHPDTVYITHEKSVSKKETTTTTNAKKEAQKDPHKPTHNFNGRGWVPTKPEPNWLDKLKACATHVLLFGGLSFLVFYWNEAGLMASSVAIPTMCVCTALAGFGVGKSCIKGDR